MPVTKVKSTWVNGDLVFKDPDGTSIFTIYSSGAVGTASSLLNEIPLSVYFASAQGDVEVKHIPMVHDGTVSKVYAVNHVAASADGSCTLTIYCSATSAGTIQIASGQASGTIKSVSLSSNNDVAASGQIKITASGLTAACPMTVTAIIKRA